MACGTIPMGGCPTGVRRASRDTLPPPGPGGHTRIAVAEDNPEIIAASAPCPLQPGVVVAAPEVARELAHPRILGERPRATTGHTPAQAGTRCPRSPSPATPRRDRTTAGCAKRLGGTSVRYSRCHRACGHGSLPWRRLNAGACRVGGLAVQCQWDPACHSHRHREAGQGAERPNPPEREDRKKGSATHGAQPSRHAKPGHGEIKHAPAHLSWESVLHHGEGKGIAGADGHPTHQ